MSVSSVSLNCLGCGAPIAVNDFSCPYCGRPIFVQTFSDVSMMETDVLNKYIEFYRNMCPGNDKADFASGLCCLKAFQFSNAATYFQKAIQLNGGNAEYYFYNAIALLERRRPYMTPPHVLKDAERQLEYAMNLGGKGIYYYLLAYIKKDFYEKRFMRTDKGSAQLLAEAKQRGLPNGDIAILNTFFDKPVII